MAEVNMHFHFESIDSTQAFAKKNYLSFSPDHITVVTADYQTNGRGTKEKKWISPPKVNLLVSFCFRLPKDFPNLPKLAIEMAASLKTVLEEEKLFPTFKWPNDLLLNQKKVAGVLCEVIFEPTFIQVIGGIGINVNMEEEDLNTIDQPATSLKVETGIDWDLNILREKLTIQLEQDLKKLL
jgi:BirA family biotin operon repressor/biotin-[acetyl-CoA-carboxylase] ligase